MGYTIETTDAPGAEVERTVRRHLAAFNYRVLYGPEAEPPDSTWQRVAALARDDAGDLVGGLLGEVGWGWLYVDILWVAEAARGQGVGRGLVQAAEAEAGSRGVDRAWVITGDFQAPGFYRRLGYEPFARLDDYPPGHASVFLKKSPLD